DGRATLACLSVSLLALLPGPFLFTATSTTECYTLSLHDALPILHRPLSALELHPAGFADPGSGSLGRPAVSTVQGAGEPAVWRLDRKSTRLNSSHVKISYAVFCLKKKKI